MLILPPLVSDDIFRQRLAEFEAWLWGDGSYELGWRHAPRPSVLARRVLELSDLYTTGREAIADESATGEHLMAKVFYFLVSDASKPVMVLRELAERYPSMVMRDADRVLRVCDAGAGVGATTVGLLLALDATKVKEVAIDGMDGHARSLDVWPIVAEYAAKISGVRVRARAMVSDLMKPINGHGSAGSDGPYDLFIAQALLNELFPTTDYDAAIAADAVRTRAQWVASHVGSAVGVMIEPALRETTRPLQAVRDHLAASGEWRVLAPCPHQLPCPMMLSQRDWCHEVRLFQPMLRVGEVQGITHRRDNRTKFSFMAVTRSTNDVAPQVMRGNLSGRLVSDALNSKGKMERHLCNGDGHMTQLRLLDRDRNDENRLLADAPRGTMVTIEGCENPPRLPRESRVVSSLPSVE